MTRAEQSVDGRESLPKDRDDPDASTTLAVGAAGAILLFALVLVLQGLFDRSVEAESERKVISQIPEELRRSRAAQTGKLSAYAWVDRTTGVVSIPIDRAMELTIEESKAQPIGVPDTGSTR